MTINIEIFPFLILLILVILLIDWVSHGIIVFIKMHKMSQKIVNHAYALLEIEQMNMDMNAAVQYYIARTELEMNAVLLIKMYKEHKKNPKKYYVTNILYSGLIGRLYSLK